MFCIYSSKKGVPRILYFMSATAKSIVNRRELSTLVVFKTTVT